MHTIHTDRAPAPAGHYSQAIVHAGLVYVAGQLPIRPDGTRVTGTVHEQTVQAIANIGAILEAAGTSLDRVLRVTVYVPDVALWPEINAAYARCFGAHRPARTVVPSRELHHSVLVEIDAIAAVGA